MKQDIIEALQRPFETSLIRSRRGPGGQTFRYVAACDYINRLNNLPCGWEFIIDELKLVNDTDVLARGRLLIDGESRSDIGGAAMTVSGEGEVVGDLANVAKSAASDLLKRCCRLFGLGTHLWAAEENPQREGSNGSNGSNGNGQRRRPNGGSNGPRLTQRQLAAIWSIGRSLGLNADEIRRWSMTAFGVMPEHLSKTDASNFISELRESLATSQAVAS